MDHNRGHKESAHVGMAEMAGALSFKLTEAL
jgi:hypothetical protein